jgi:charged multivesicular body protein 2A
VSAIVIIINVGYLYIFSDGIVNQVLDELGIQINDQLANLPTAGSIAAPAVANKVPVAAMSDADADLQARLENLRKE